jgi:membrane protein DedA with SNARE-associated domain
MLSFLTSHDLAHLIHVYGYWIVALVIGLESMGLPLPGETTLIVASIYSARSHDTHIWLVIAAAICGAVIGDNVGYWLGREFGYRLLLRYGRYIMISDARIKLGEYLFRRHGGKVVFFGRFIAVLRALAAFLAGVNRMPWDRFVIFNIAGGAVWATTFGLAAYYFGKEVERVGKEVGLVLIVLAAIAIGIGLILLRRHEAELQAEAERAIPGPLRTESGRPFPRRDG